jgi:hypothetical protein
VQQLSGSSEVGWNLISNKRVGFTNLRQIAGLADCFNRFALLGRSLQRRYL